MPMTMQVLSALILALIILLAIRGLAWLWEKVRDWE